MFEWRENISCQEWDNLLSFAKGHPLQSAVWGNVKEITNGISDKRWAVFQDKSLVYLVRFETRYFFKMIKVAWIPRGPILLSGVSGAILQQQFLKRLKKCGFFLCCSAPWTEIEYEQEQKTHFLTVWIDLTLGKDKLWSNLHKQFRYDVRKSKKLNVIVEKSKSLSDVQAFYKICETLSVKKNFSLTTSVDLMMHLLQQNHSDQVESYLFSARHEGNFCGGAFILRCGDNIHYMWGAIDREFSHVGAGEALQWEVIEWAITLGCKKYDLEGITSTKKSGADYFKQKMGGNIVSNPGIQIDPLNFIGKGIAFILKLSILLVPKLKFGKKIPFIKKFGFLSNAN